MTYVSRVLKCRFDGRVNFFGSLFTSPFLVEFVTMVALFICCPSAVAGRFLKSSAEKPTRVSFTQILAR